MELGYGYLEDLQNFEKIEKMVSEWKLQETSRDEQEKLIRLNIEGLRLEMGDEADDFDDDEIVDMVLDHID